MRAPGDERPRIFYGWWVALASLVGASLCQSPVVFLTLGVFMIPLEQEFGWDRAQVSLGLSVGALSLAVCTPLVGILLDRIGPRRVLLTSLVLYGSGTALLSLMGPSLWVFYLSLAVIGLLGAGSNTMSYARVLSAWFDRRRGIALGLTMSGIGLGHAIATVFAQTLIQWFDWRVAYAGLGSAVLLIALPVVYFVVRESPEEMGLLPDGATPDELARRGAVESWENPRTGGLSRAEAFGTSSFWMLVLVFFTLAVAIHGVQVHLVPLFRDAGIAATGAAVAAGLVGLTASGGRIVFGYLFDRFFAPRVAIVAFLSTGLGFVVLTVTDSLALAITCSLLLGVGASSESDLLAYLSSRYFGPKAFGELYGYVFAAFMLGTALGPYLVGLGYEMANSYVPTLWACFGGTLVVCVLLSRLGPFPEWSGLRAGAQAGTGRAASADQPTG